MSLMVSSGGGPTRSRVSVSSTGVRAVTTVNTTIGGQQAQLLVPEAPNGGLLLYSHGSSEPHTVITDGGDGKAPIFAGATAAGWIVAASNGSGGGGTQACVNDNAALHAFVASNYGTPTRVVNFGQSLGGLAALTSTGQRPYRCDGVLLIYPVCSWLTWYGSAGGVLDPVLQPASVYAGVKMRFYASPDDTVVPKTSHTDAMVAVIANDPAEHVVQVCVGNHGHPSHFQTSDSLAFLARCLA